MLAIIAERLSEETMSISTPLTSGTTTADLSDSIGYHIRRSLNDGQKNSCCTIRTFSTLFPITDGSNGEAEGIRECLLR